MLPWFPNLEVVFQAHEMVVDKTKFFPVVDEEGSVFSVVVKQKSFVTPLGLTIPCQRALLHAFFQCE